MSPRNRNILTVEDWPHLQIGKLYKGVVKKVDADKKAQCLQVSIENLNRIQLGRIHQISLPLPIRPSIYHQTCSFLLACGIDATSHGKNININDAIGAVIGIRFGTKEQNGSQQIDFEKNKDKSNTADTIDRKEMLPLNQDTNGLDQNNGQVQ
jgi:hypothetical protein